MVPAATDPTESLPCHGELLDWKIDLSADGASVCAEDGRAISFNQVADYAPPTWPTPEQVSGSGAVVWCCGRSSLAILTCSPSPDGGSNTCR